MKVLITEYLRINLDTETWECRVCDHQIGPARDNYKEGLLVYDRDPTEIHKPLLDPARYRHTFAPNPAWCAILEYYCPSCGTLVEVEYIVPGHPPVRDIELDIDALKAQWANRTEQLEHVPAGEPAHSAQHQGHGHQHSR
jgi:acetone carboxylase gamma subunit